MTDSNPDKPRRRPRYRGKNPRHFHEKYKEHQPDLYPDEGAKVSAAGRTPAGTHRPIMVREILEVLSPQPGAVAVDCTLGYGGHAQGFWPPSGPAAGYWASTPIPSSSPGPKPACAASDFQRMP